jgi:hypothetical protein
MCIHFHHHLHTVLHLTLLRQPISQRIFLPMFHKSEPGHSQQKYTTAWKITKDIIFDLFKMVMKVIPNIAENQEMIDTFQECV